MTPDSNRDAAPPSAKTALRAVVEDATGEPLRIGDGTGAAEDGGGSHDGSKRSAERTTTLMGRDEEPAPMERLLTLLESVSSLVCVVPRVDPRLVDTLSSTVGGASHGVPGSEDSDPVEARIVLTGAARGRVTGATGRMAVAALESTDGIELFVHDGDSPVGLLLADERAVVGLFDDAGLAALLVTDDEAVRAWAGRTIRRYLSAATDP